MEKMIDYDYVWIDGKTLPNTWVDSYNQYSKDINIAKSHDAVEMLKDSRHEFLVWCLNEQKIKEIQIPQEIKKIVPKVITKTRQR